jgi:hypothetical protein
MSGDEAGYPAEGSSMEQVRELLFGTQIKEMEIRMQRQEERFQREVADARDALKKRLDSLENFMKSETSSILNRIGMEKAERESAFKDSKREFEEAVKNEQRERGEALAQIAKELDSSVEVLERKLSALAASLDSTERELRQLLLTESGSLSDKSETLYRQALEALKLTSDQIRHDMVYRSALSGLFTETAVKLSGGRPSEAAARGGKPAAGSDSSGRKEGKDPAKSAQNA